MIALPVVALLSIVLSPAETRGRQIFLRGTSASGREVTAVVAGNPSPAPMACASCHGRDGRGKAEGGVRSALLDWDALARPSAGRPAYDAARLRRAITTGLDPADRRLGPVMPRYQLWREDADDLIAWLRRLGTIREPGVDETRLRLRVEGPMRPVFRAWANDVNARGGVYARRVEVAEDDDAFAILGEPGAALTQRAIDDEIPVLRLGTLGAAEGPSVFDLGPSALEEADQLLAIAAAQDAMPVAIAPGPFAVRCQPPRCSLAVDVSSARSALVIDPAAMPAAGRLALIPSALAAEALPRARGDAYVASRILPGDVDREAAARFQLSGERLVDQWSALAVGRLVERALVRTGRDLTREAFVEALESEYEAPTGFSPPVTFDTGRHHGIGVVRLLRFDYASGRLSDVGRATDKKEQHHE